MNKTERIEDIAFLVYENLAFVFEKIDNQKHLLVINLNNHKQKIVFKYLDKDNSFVMLMGSMSETNTYKVLLIVEKNKERLARGIQLWGNM